MAGRDPGSTRLPAAMRAGHSDPEEGGACGTLRLRGGGACGTQERRRDPGFTRRAGPEGPINFAGTRVNVALPMSEARRTNQQNGGGA